MKIYLFCVGEPIPTNTSDVRLRRMGMLATILAKNGHDVHWFSSTFDHYKKVDLFDVDTNYEYNGFVVHALKTITYSKNISFKRVKFHKLISRKIYKYLQDMEKPDIIMGSMEPIEVSKVMVKYANENKIKVVIDVRDLWPEIFYDAVPKILRPLLWPYVSLCKIRLRKVFKDCTSIVAPSKDFLEYGLKYSNRPRGKNDLVFNMGYSKEVIEKVEDGNFNIVFFGTIGKQFEFEKVFKAAEKLQEYKNIVFYIAGDGEFLEQYKIKYNFSNIKFLGWIEKKQINEILSIASVGLAPYINSINYQRNMPNKIGEYLSIGIPILVNCDGVIPNILEKYDCGYKYADSQDLYDKILSLYNNKEKYKKMCENTMLCYDENMNADIIYQKLCDYLLKLKEDN